MTITTDSTVDYRALMTCSAKDGWLTTAEDQFAAWLRNKKQWDIDPRSDGRHDDGLRSIEVLHHSGRHSQSLRARLVERDTPMGTWTTDLLAHDLRGQGDWLRVTVENDRGKFVAVPMLARYLMQTLPLGDGSIEFVDGPQIWDSDRVDELIDLLCDEERHGLVLVAGSDDSLPFDSFAAKIGSWTREAYGLAQVIVLTPRATDAFAAEWGSVHAAPAWTIRTYLPAVDPASPIDARRHRILGTTRLAHQSDGATRHLLGRIVRTHAAQRPIPTSVLRTVRDFDRLANEAIVSAMAEGPVAIPVRQESAEAAPATIDLTAASDTGSEIDAADTAHSTELIGDEAESYLAQVQLVKTIFRIDSLDEVALRRIAQDATARVDPSAITRAAQQIENQQRRIEWLEDSVSELRNALDDEHIELATVQLDVDQRAAEVRWLRARAKDEGDFESSFGAVPIEAETDYPRSFADLLPRFEELSSKGVVFTGDESIALDLDDHDTLALAVRAAWDALLSLADYLRARGAGQCSNGVDHYLNHTPPGYHNMSARKHAVTETAATMQQFGAERVFPVPTDFDKAGRATMTAHFKLARIGMVSPRMHYLDGFARTGTVYVGYIGPHLTTTRS